MINKVIHYVKEQHMFDAGDYVVAGVSGGADSVCLLFMLLEIKKIVPIDLHIVHINHEIRKDAGEDAQYVQQLCAEYALPFTLVEEDVTAFAAKEHCSTEEAGRRVRYRAFYKALGENRGKIAVAHNKNDSCETFLFHLFRGSALKGLGGIPAVRGVIVRPLLCLERAEIEVFLAQRHIKFRIDSTNLEDNYTRNKIRHHILAWAENEISPAAVSHIGEACGKIKEAYELIADLAQKGYHECVCEQDAQRYHLNEAQFAALHQTVQGYVIMEMLVRVSGSGKNWEAVHVEQIKNLLQKQSGRQIHLPYGLTAIRDYKGIVIQKQGAQAGESPVLPEIELSEQDKHCLLRGEILKIPWQQKIIEISLIKSKNLQNIPQKKYTKWFDYDTIEGSIVIRTRREGDYLTVSAANQRKSLKSYFIDNKVPREERGQICLVAEGSHIIWVVGGRISNSYKVLDNTETILQISFVDGAKKSGMQGFSPGLDKTKED